MFRFCADRSQDTKANVQDNSGGDWNVVRLGCNLQCYILWWTKDSKNQQHGQVSDMAAAVLQKQTSLKNHGHQTQEYVGLLNNRKFMSNTQ